MQETHESFPAPVEAILNASQFEHIQRVNRGGHFAKDAHFRVVRMIEDARSDLMNEAKNIPTHGVDFLRPAVDLELPETTTK